MAQTVKSVVYVLSRLGLTEGVRVQIHGVYEDRYQAEANLSPKALLVSETDHSQVYEVDDEHYEFIVETFLYAEE